MNRQTFIDEIQKNREDWFMRNVFADWLEEQGDPECKEVRKFINLMRSHKLNSQGKPKFNPAWKFLGQNSKPANHFQLLGYSPFTWRDVLGIKYATNKRNRVMYACGTLLDGRYFSSYCTNISGTGWTRSVYADSFLDIKPAAIKHINQISILVKARNHADPFTDHF